jgi:hypothetical protein
MVEQSIVVAIGIILGLDVNLLIAYIVSIRSKFDGYFKERRDFLDSDFLSKVNDINKKTDIKIDAFLPMFEEHGEIESWKDRIPQVYFYMFYSVLFTLAGFFFALFDIKPIQGFPSTDIIFLISGAFFTGAMIYRIAGLDYEMRKWKLSCEETRKKAEIHNVL